ncbi:hypothetical protein BC830DRAFT_559387 [Chytriomyces sp. MP71]|nr:hypothetical protein BC830DRAFT_559387 [Chytriomyces sp. MP71]
MLPECPKDVDPQVWAQLPDDIRRELSGDQCGFHGDAASSAPLGGSSPSTGIVAMPVGVGMDASVWNSLPVELQLELATEVSLSPNQSTSTSVALFSVPQSGKSAIHIRNTTANLRLLAPTFGARKEAQIMVPPPAGNHHARRGQDWKFSAPIESDAMVAFTDPATVADGALFTDSDFQPNASSIDGIKDAIASSSSSWPLSSSSSSASSSPPVAKAAKQAFPTCTCPSKPSSRLRKVSKENKNNGRQFFSCAKGQPPAGCNFFMWAPTTGAFALQHSAKDAAIEWKRLSPADGYALVRATSQSMNGAHQYSAMHVNQGSVGDCWMISALAVLAEHPHLLERVLPPNQEENLTRGFLHTRLYIDGKWRPYTIDNYFALQDPVSLKKTQAVNAFNAPIFTIKGTHGPALHFAKSLHRMLWVPAIEKAYAKAHGSYKNISGGHISEALFDLTGYPTESIHFGSDGFDSELIWTRLLSFHSQRFLMGASCPTSGEGLVGCHAYSILRVVEENCFAADNGGEDDGGIVIGRARTLLDYDFGIPGEKRKRGLLSEAEDYGVTENGMLRLVQLRNPWGKVEWKGRFGVNSAEWSASLRKRLKVFGSSEESGGTFWMSYHDFLQVRRVWKSFGGLPNHYVAN